MDGCGGMVTHRRESIPALEHSLHFSQLVLEHPALLQRTQVDSK